MSSLQRLKRVFTLTDRTVSVVECRQCGTSLTDETETCPECGSQEIACYEF
ncbi:small CPxCG-related zinc finger protein [Natronomonas pharaonis DSM 2160]|uniref:Small CPxCG-related zinc finger protein n=1 Tax=Natronomonas pharaonis (strain ATCC 35678 / DSM 2160 / CIP 103997 / JCM 8858 / NBRC 14720 / NCIMB 2260 / Gabara) TaxID=348780 RepID=A0A1U7EZN7_NATPD|nr:small CPxCG-related zinc finger protein [Natronomonas pharaonis DSM 2160]